MSANPSSREPHRATEGERWRWLWLLALLLTLGFLWIGIGFVLWLIVGLVR